MKLFSRHGQKVLEAPIEPENAYPSFTTEKGIQRLQYTLELYTKARDTQYILSLNPADIAALKKILEVYECP